MTLHDEYVSLLIRTSSCLLGIYYMPGVVLITLQILSLLIHVTGILYGKVTFINSVINEGTEALTVRILLWITW